ncbi:hypothetical protein QR680_011454 [Steinernema hermaphroditum]|uniref:Ig-like domain-containing protein n=1 Tax=Steinernema hermaphroditum TaxID=289476 RepID=A0AA39LZ02_9BILA|nr:hypothetical protein QR680_011454 [Steinernema hermaphroditum]
MHSLGWLLVATLGHFAFGRVVSPQNVVRIYSSNPYSPTDDLNLSSIYRIPREDAEVIFNCTSSDSPALYWTLPDGTNVRNANESDPEAMFNAVKGQLRISKIKPGMDGEYVCVNVDENERRSHFFIPYIIARTDYSRSLTISIAVTVVFVIACAIVLLFDRFYSRGVFRRGNSYSISRKHQIHIAHCPRKSQTSSVTLT